MGISFFIAYSCYPCAPVGARISRPPGRTRFFVFHIPQGNAAISRWPASRTRFPVFLFGFPYIEGNAPPPAAPGSRLPRPERNNASGAGKPLAPTAAVCLFRPKQNGDFPASRACAPFPSFKLPSIKRAEAVFIVSPPPIPCAANTQTKDKPLSGSGSPVAGFSYLCALLANTKPAYPHQSCTAE